MFPGCFCFSVVAPLDLEVLDGAALSTSFFFIQYADGPLTVGQITLKVNGLVIDVLVETGLVRKLETFPEWCRVEKRCAQWVTQVITLAGSHLLFVL